MTTRDFIRTLTASERPEVHTTIARALALLGEQDAASIRLIRADTADSALSLASTERPHVAFLDVTLGGNAGLGLVHFLQTSVPGIVVIAIVPEEPGRDVRMVEQAASLGAAYVLLGELTGDDVLRAFTKVAPSFTSTSVVHAPRSAPAQVGFDASPIVDARSFHELEARLVALTAQLPDGDARGKLLSEVRTAIGQCVAQERADRAPMQDLTSSAYSFAYFVDLAGREIDLARRHGRRFALATVEVEPDAPGAPKLDSRGTVELVLSAVRDTDVVARADENELLLLLPETGAKGARTLRRRIIDRLRQQQQRAPKETRDGAASTSASTSASTEPSAGIAALRVGLASFPFDGEDLSRLLRIARRRGERWAPLDPTSAMGDLLARSLAWLAAPREGHGALASPPSPNLAAIDVPLRDAWALFDTLVRESTRGGDATIGLHAPHGSSEAPLGLAQGIRAATAEATTSSSAPSSRSSSDRQERFERDTLTVITGPSRLLDAATFDGLEVVGILAEHACYGLVGRVIDGRLIGVQTHDLPLVEELVLGLEQPVLRRSTLHSASGSGSPSSSAPSSSLRGSRSDSTGLRR